MFLSFAVAATVLGSPPQMALASELPKGALFLVLASKASMELAPHPRRAADESKPTLGEQVRGWLDHLAVVRPPHLARKGRQEVQMFITPAPVGGHVGPGLLAIGYF
jgi:hypothetical protein